MKKILLILSLVIVNVLNVFAQPTTAPPAGKVWSLTSSGTHASGPLFTGGASGNKTMTCNGTSVPTICGSNDTSFGWDVQCSTTPTTTVGTPGANFLQAQKYGNTGTADNNLSGLAAPCNPGVSGTSAGSNWPASTSETRRVTLTNWNNTKPDVAGATEICIPKTAILRFRDDGVGNGTGAGADELRLTMIGGVAGQCASWKIDASYNLSIAVSGAYGAVSGVNGTKITQAVTQTLNNVPNAGAGAYNATDNAPHNAGCGNFQTSANSWYFSGGANTPGFGTGHIATHDVFSAVQTNGSTFNVDFTSAQSIAIDRVGGSNGDARATMGPGLGGKVELIVTYECWTAITPLPVTLKSFDAKVNDSRVVLDWETSYEKNSSHFEIERSIDAINFVQIGNKKSIGGEKISTNYQYIDEKPENGIAYYRLRQVDLDGKTDYSKIKSVNFEDLGGFRFGPNPSNGTVIFRGISSGSSIEIIDMQGRILVLKNFNESTSEFNVETKEFTHGLYIVRFIKNGRINTQKLVVD